MLVLSYTDTFMRWRAALRVNKALVRIAARLERLEDGHWGDAQSLGGGMTELRLHFRAGLPAVCCTAGGSVGCALCGGDKSSQRRDVALPQQLALELNSAP